jgi:hypothetical protein
MFTGEFVTYLDVRQFVEATYGPLDDDSEIRFLTFLSNSLVSMWADLKDDPWYLTEWTVEPEEGAFAIPAGMARVCSITGTVEAVLPETEDTTIAYEIHDVACSSPSCSLVLPTNVERIEIGTSEFAFGEDATTPDSLSISGYRRPTLTFFTVEEGEDGPCFTWADIDLPEQYRTIYPKAVVGMMFFGGGDAPRGADWLNLANGEFQGVKRATRGARPGATAAERGIYQMGTRAYLKPEKCCNVTENWRLSL